MKKIALFLSLVFLFNCFALTVYPLSIEHIEEISSSKFVETFDDATIKEIEAHDYYISALIKFKYENPNDNAYSYDSVVLTDDILLNYRQAYTMSNVSISDLKNDETYIRNVTRREVEKHYKALNQEIAKQLNIDNLVISYSTPFAEVMYDSIEDYYKNKNELIALSKKDIIETISVDISVFYDELNDVASIASDEYLFSQALTDVGISDNTYNGTGIKIGVIEQGLPFDGGNVPSNKLSCFGEVKSLHAAQVTTVLGGNTGVAKGASIYCAALDDVGMVASLNWLVALCDVDIINVSLGSFLNGKYSNRDAFFDFYVNNYRVCIVAASGNFMKETNFNANIPSPGLASNVITVGATNKNKVRASYSLYHNNVSSLNKPDLVAPGGPFQNFGSAADEFGEFEGTSFSAPIVAGIIARLMQQYPILKSRPELVKTVLMASCNKLSSQTSEIDPKVGAGLVNYNNAKRVINNYAVGSKNANMKAGDATTVQLNFTLGYKDIINLYFSDLVPGSTAAANLNETTVTYSKYFANFYVTNAGMNLLAYSKEITPGNSDFISFVSTYTGSTSYKMVIVLVEDAYPTKSESLAVTYTK